MSVLNASTDYRRDVFGGVVPLSQRVVALRETFLPRIERIVIPTYDKAQGYAIDVYLSRPPHDHNADHDADQDDDNDADATRHNRPPAFTIHRTYADLKELHRLCEHWCSKHVELAATYGIPVCSYCAPFIDPTRIGRWPHGLTRHLHPHDALAKTFSERLMEYVHFAQGERNHALRCEGIEHVPSILGRFLLRDVDAATLDHELGLDSSLLLH